jgi:hypothetical protein
VDNRQTRAIALLAGNGASLAYVAQWVLENADTVVTVHAFATRAALIFISLGGLGCAYGMLAWPKPPRTMEMLAIVGAVGPVFALLGYLWGGVR